MSPFVPTLHDLESARTILASLRLPNELVLCILDEARYWVQVETISREHIVLMDRNWSLDYSAAYPYLYLLAYPWPHRLDLKIREIEFTIVSHDQEWTTEPTQGTYQTSSWFEASIVRPKGTPGPRHYRFPPGLRQLQEMYPRGETSDSIYAAIEVMHPNGVYELVRRPSSTAEPQRLHCTEMMETKPPGIEEGEHAWYVQGNEVAREKSIFEGEIIKRYNITWGCKANPVRTTGEGTGRGDDFIDTLERDDFICVWARAKRRGWENHVHGIRVVIRYMI